MSSKIQGSSSAAAVTAYAGDDDATEATSVQKRELLPAPFGALAGSADVGAQITALLVCASREQKQEAREARQAAETAQESAENRELSKMDQQAAWKLTSGLVSGAAQAASGAVTIGSAGAAAESAERVSAKGTATAMEATGKLGSAGCDYAASGAEKSAKQASMQAGHAKTAVDDARDLDKDAKEMLNRALGYYKEYLTAKADTQRATLLKA